MMPWLREVMLRRRLYVIVIWLAVLVAAVPFAVRMGDHLTSGGFDVPGSQSELAASELRAAFPNQQAERLSVLLVGAPDATPADYQAGLTFVQRAAATQQVTPVVVDPQAIAAIGQSRYGAHRYLVPLEFQASFDRTVDLARSLSSTLLNKPSNLRSVDVYLVGRTAQGAALQEQSKQSAAVAESLGFPVVLLILLFVFGSLAAAALPLALGVVSVTLTGAAIYFVSQAIEMSVFVTNVTSLIGIGVAVDYALFMLVRYREEIAKGATREEAERTMRRTSGRVVLFSGVTVVVSVASIFVLNNTALRSLALGAMIVVGISVVGATMLVPALIRVFGGRLERPRRRAARRGFWSRWVGLVIARPWRSLVLAGGLLLLLSLPVLGMRVGDDTIRQLPPGNHARQGAGLAATLEGAGAQSPLLVVVRVRNSVQDTDPIVGELRQLGRQVAAAPEVSAVTPPTLSQDGKTLFVAVVAHHEPEDERVVALVQDLRHRILPASPLSHDPNVLSMNVGGSPATALDLAELVTGKLPLVAGLLLALSYVVLLVVLRSVLLPLKAILLDLLSVGAALGVLVIVFQWQPLQGLGLRPSVSRLQAVALPLVLAVVFGLSMDYEVFLLTRIRERYEATRHNSFAVAQGIASSAPTVTSAALIMVAVFTVFATVSVPVVQQIGLGCAVAVAVDATITRMVLLPALMQLLGEWNWWMPRWLDRRLPGFPAPHPDPPPRGGREVFAS
ncbi:MAG: MMPL family transporter [Candidatus Dormibacteraeota bacterium]|nr:MMPL family transporter [Candidatus Dormibacteraeota bacterium]